MMIDMSHASGHRALSRSLCTDAGRSPHSGVSGRFLVGVSGVTAAARRSGLGGGRTRWSAGVSSSVRFRVARASV